MKKKSNMVVLVLGVLSSLLFHISLSNPTSATTSTLNVSIANSISVELLPSSSGTFATSPTNTNTISITTNHGTGYTLGIRASNDGVNYLSSTGGGTIPSITTSVSEATFSSSSDYNNKWGYRPSKLDSTSNNNYLQAPTSDSSITVLDRTNVANASDANTYNIAIGARVNNNISPGSYSNTMVLTVIANPSVYSITYDANGGSGAPSNVSNETTSGTSVTLSSTVPTWTGYTFQGWCTTQVSVDASCTGTSYAKGSTWVIDQTAAVNSLALYAVWKKDISFVVNFDSGVKEIIVKQSSIDAWPTTYVTSSGSDIGTYVQSGQSYYLIPLYDTSKTFNNWSSTGGTITSGTYGYYYYTVASGNNVATLSTKDLTTSVTSYTITAMQNMSSSVCTANPVAVRDNRDNAVYYIQRLADGKCWMLENLRLGSTSTTYLTSSNTNIVSSYTLPKSGTVCFRSPSMGTCTATDGSTGNGQTKPAINADYKTHTTTDYGLGRGYVGTYYNYCAASGGTICVEDNTNDGVYDICPKGWRLPTSFWSDGDGDAQLLKKAYNNSDSNFNQALSATLSGSFANSSRLYVGTIGSYWTSSVYGSGNMREIQLKSNSCTFNQNAPNHFGHSIRCLLKS